MNRDDDASKPRLFVPQPVPDFEEDLPADPVSEAQARASTYGKEFDAEAEEFLVDQGGSILDRNLTVLGFPMDFLVRGTNGRLYYVDGHGTPDRTVRPQAGMRRTDTMLKFGFKVLCLHTAGCEHPVILLTSHMPAQGSSSAFYLSQLHTALFDAMSIFGDAEGRRRMSTYLTAEPPSDGPIGAGWRLGAQQSFWAPGKGWEEEDDDA